MTQQDNAAKRRGRCHRFHASVVVAAILGVISWGCSDDTSEGDAGGGEDVAADTAADTEGADLGADVVDEDTGQSDSDASDGPTTQVEFQDPRPLLPTLPGDPPTTTDIHFVDLNGEGGKQMMITEANKKEVSWVHDCSDLSCSVKTKKLGQLNTPVRARDVDFDGDGDKDLLVADVGGLMGAHEGALMLLKNDGNQNFSAEVLVDEIGQVTWAEPTDMDDDGDPDVVLAIFSGPKKGLHWLEQKDDGSVERHVIAQLKGLTHVAHADFDEDGKRDLVGVFSETVEEVILFRNQGDQTFESETIMEGKDECWGLTGLHEVDLDQDGHLDLVTVNGDAYDEGCDTEKLIARHGIDWLRNDGSGEFERHRIGTLKASINARTADFNGDGNLDVLVSSQWSSRDFDGEAPPPMVWFEYDGDRGFERHPIENAPTGAVSMEVTDWDDDDVPDLVTGSLRFKPDVDAQRLSLIQVERTEEQ